MICFLTLPYTGSGQQQFWRAGRSRRCNIIIDAVISAIIQSAHIMMPLLALIRACYLRPCPHD
eukprot:scaffold203192_cov19-Prasinocladus_malaysianus.AAC.1